MFATSVEPSRVEAIHGNLDLKREGKLRPAEFGCTHRVPIGRIRNCILYSVLRIRCSFCLEGAKIVVVWKQGKRWERESETGVSPVLLVYSHSNESVVACNRYGEVRFLEVLDFLLCQLDVNGV